MRRWFAALALVLVVGCGGTATRHSDATITTPRSAVAPLAPIVARIDAHDYASLHRHTFENREHRLPREPRDFYSAYDVRRPGSSGRGPQRLIVGRDGSVWFTSDHYDRFVRLR